jgi:hypothetical protein
MDRYKNILSCTRSFQIGLFLLLAIRLDPSKAATIWTGPNVTWTKSAATPSDTIVPGKVVLMRGARDVLYNKAAGENAAGTASPKDTMWAFGNIANATTLQYKTLESLRNGNLALRLVNQPMVVHLIAEDIYFSLTFTTWGTHQSGTVSYTRSTPPAAIPPTVSITTPASGATFSAPASVQLTANASVSGGTVTNVEYFAGATSLGHAGAAPFSVTANIAAAGSYSITAVATGGGLSSTSAPVNITVSAVAAASLAITSPADGAVFAAPADVKFTVDANGNGSTITNVSYFNQRSLLGSTQTAPFDFTAPGLAPGAYTVSATATAAGVSANAAAIHFTVVAAVVPTLTGPSVNNGVFSFSYSANSGLKYVVEKALSMNPPGVFEWTPLTTNNASGDSIPFSERLSTDNFRFFRVGRLPNP